MSFVLVTISYSVEPAKREAYLRHAREMKEHAVENLKLDYRILEDTDRPGHFTELFTCASREEYEGLDERQDDKFRSFVAALERFTDLATIQYAALQSIR